MSWLDRVLQAMQEAVVIGERVERMANDVALLAGEMRELDRRLSQLEGAFAILMSDMQGRNPPKLR